MPESVLVIGLLLLHCGLVPVRRCKSTCCSHWLRFESAPWYINIAVYLLVLLVVGFQASYDNYNLQLGFYTHGPLL